MNSPYPRAKKMPKSERTQTAAAKQQGAVQSKTRISDRLDAWIAHHSNTAIDSLMRLLRTPLQSLMTWLVIAIAVALPAAFYVVLTNVQNIGYSWQDSSQISVFLHKNVSSDTAEKLRSTWTSRDDVIKAVYVSPDEALEEFKAASGLGPIVESLDENPLPGVLLINPGLASRSPDTLAELEQALRADPSVADVRLDMQWVKRLHQFMEVMRRLVLGLAVLLALGVILVVGNTIRLAIENRKDEILVIKLVGGTNAYVRRPFLYTGLWYGLGGGVLAAILLGIGMEWLEGPVARLADLYQSSFRLEGLGLIASLQLVLQAGVTGLLGAWIAVARHLSQIEPH